MCKTCTKNLSISLLCDLMVHAGFELCADNTVPVAQKTHGNHSVTRAWTQRRCCWCFWTAFIQRFFYLVSKILLGLNKKYAYVIKKTMTFFSFRFWYAGCLLLCNSGLMTGLHCGNRVRVRKEDIYSGGKFNISVQTFRCMNFWRGSYHKSKTRPDGTAPHRNVLSVYGFLAETQRAGLSVCSCSPWTNRLTRVTQHCLPTLHLLQPLVSGIFTDMANFLWPTENIQVRTSRQIPLFGFTVSSFLKIRW